jgi:hypothetical protein
MIDVRLLCVPAAVRERDRVEGRGSPERPTQAPTPTGRVPLRRGSRDVGCYCFNFKREPPARRPHCLAERRTLHHQLSCQSIAHMGLHQEETIELLGGSTAPKPAGMLRVLGASPPPSTPKPITGESCDALPVCHSCPTRGDPVRCACGRAAAGRATSSAWQTRRSVVRTA